MERRTKIGPVSFLAAVLHLTLACGAQDEGPTVVEQMLEQRWFSSSPGFAAPPWFSRCATVQPGFDGEDATYDPLSDPFCTVEEEMEVWEEDGQLRMRAHYYVLRMGEPDPDATLLSWHRDGAYYCYFEMSLTTEPVPGYPESDVQHVVGVYTARGDNCGTIPLGATRVTNWLRTSREGVFADVSREADPKDVTFRGWLGLPDTAIPGETTPFELTWPVVPCTPTPTSTGEGPGVCGPRSCRTFSPDGELRACNWQDLRALPANPDLIDPAWTEAFPELYDEVFPSR